LPKNNCQNNTALLVSFASLELPHVGILPEKSDIRNAPLAMQYEMPLCKKSMSFY
jgi:hypothetical protein